MTQTLDQYFSLHRRYYRSINLERDFDQPAAVEGYVLTARSGEALQRIITAIANPKAHHAWTITGAYGTGKSAFALFLAALCAPKGSAIANTALAIAHDAFPADSPIFAAIANHIPAEGLVRAVVAGQREPLRWTIIRALTQAIHQVWAGKRKPAAFTDLLDWDAEVSVGRCTASNQHVLASLQTFLQLSSTDMFIIIDELGKNLEYAAQHRSTDDLYLLQQIAELRKGKRRVSLLGLLHQSFVGYSEQLTTNEQNEWNKIQGRFENLQLLDTPSHTTRLIGRAIAQADPISLVCHQQAQQWHQALQAIACIQDLTVSVLAAICPLHPLTALILPLLCTRYAQNDRSLFTFLTSEEPHGLTQFLQTHTLAGDEIPTLKLHQLYDYFVESAAGLVNQVNLQRWVEIQRLIQESQTSDEAVLQVLKTIGILNLVASTGSFKATPELVALALCDRPTDDAARQHWHHQIDQLKAQGIITHRVLANELRIWEGSDFNVEAAILQHLESQRRSPLAQILTQTHPLKPTVAQRHYTTTGNLRYFEQRYVDTMAALTEVRCQLAGADGLIGYWLAPDAPSEVPAFTADGKPLVLITTQHLEQLRLRAQHLQALQTIRQTAPELEKDVVARKEVNHRLSDADRLLNDTMQQAFRSADEQNPGWIVGQRQIIGSPREFQTALSDVCDRVYPQGAVLDNELINRRELTSQGAKARRELIEAMLKHADKPRLGLDGYGPEVAIYGSVLDATGIHRQENGIWGFYPPPAESGVATVWAAIAQFCLDATEKPRSLDQLYHQLAQPPYGVKSGVVPVLLAAVLLHWIDEVSVYKDGTFIPVLGAEHFELLVKAPERFAVKHIAVVGLRSQVFRELEAILRSSPAKGQPGTRNLTILSVVKPLVQFVRKLPAYTVKSKRISAPAQAVIQTLLQTQEPDELLFSALPQACGLDPIRLSSAPDAETDAATARQFREQLVQILREIHTAYEVLLKDCETLLYNAFGLRSDRDQLRLDLQFRAKYLLGNCAERTLDRFVRAAVDETKDQQAWLEALLMIVADKPAEAWSDADFVTFEHNLGDLARRFKNWEALQKDVAASHQGGFEARRLTVTRPDGSEIHSLVCTDQEQKKQLQAVMDEILAKCPSPQLQQALLAQLAEQVLGDSPAPATPRDRRRATTR